MKKKTLLSGDRPTGPLHIGHYIGTLKNRIKMQHEYETFIMVADSQAITDYYDNVSKVKQNVYDVVADYIACGIDPQLATIFIQSMIPQLPEITQYLMNVISINRIGHNPTVKTELKQKGFEESVPAGFYLYPIYQASDIIAFDADAVPVGVDQAPMVELTRDVVKKFNSQYSKEVFTEPEAVFAKIEKNLPGLDGNKMSKSLGNAIYLKDSRDEIVKKVKKMKSDASRTSISDPGNPDEAVAFSYLDHFDEDQAEVEKLKEQYRQGGIGDKVIKERTLEVLDAFIAPIRERRAELFEDKSYIEKVLREGTEVAFERAAATLKRQKAAMGLEYDFLMTVKA
ncbi:MAG: Tryptophan--tRNA ligase 2 [Chlamydiia bacterium]|nr:Tryptophan--tRNA ligase 2 [Chlamydiia bacterium]